MLLRRQHPALLRPAWAVADLGLAFTLLVADGLRVRARPRLRRRPEPGRQLAVPVGGDGGGGGGPGPERSVASW
ncbi:MAG: hypothetical protein R2755_34830 [Acidimicrobiales bacterium]